MSTFEKLKNKIMSAIKSGTEIEADGDQGVRTVITDPVADSITPTKLASILKEAVEGDPAEFFELAQEMEERDGHYGSVLATRKLKIAGIEPELHPASDDDKDQEIAQAVRDDILDHPEFVFMLLDVLDALGKGVSLIQIKWNTEGNRWKPETFTWIDPRWITFDKKTKRQIRIKDKNAPEGKELAEYGFITHVPRLKSGLPARGGLARLAVWSWLLKSFSVKDWAAFCEIFGQPLRLGRYDGNASAKDKRALLQAVRSIARDAAAIIPKSMDMELVATKSNGGPVFKDFAEYLDKQISKIILGQTMTADNGSSMAQAKVHDDVRLDIAQADGKQISFCLQRDLIIPYVNLNFGVQEKYPTIKIEPTEAEDLDLLSKVLERLVKLGLKVSEKEVRDRFGYRELDDDETYMGQPDEVTEADKSKQSKGDKKELNKTNLNHASHDHHHHNHEMDDELDAISALALEDWELQGNGMLDPIQVALNKANSLEEFADNLAGIISEQDMGHLTDKLAGVTTISKSLGDGADDTLNGDKANG